MLITTPVVDVNHHSCRGEVNEFSLQLLMHPSGKICYALEDMMRLGAVKPQQKTATCEKKRRSQNGIIRGEKG